MRKNHNTNKYPDNVNVQLHACTRLHLCTQKGICHHFQTKWQRKHVVKKKIDIPVTIVISFRSIPQTRIGNQKPTWQLRHENQDNTRN